MDNCLWRPPSSYAVGSYGAKIGTGYGVQPGSAPVSTTGSGSGQRSRINYYRMVIKALKTKQNLLKHVNALMISAVKYMTSRMETWNQLVHIAVNIVCITRNTINNYE